ncbi:MAG TPA: serine protease [Lacipirellulaceae bacterium]|nr:serine protease [Lacipirellulaceae bacterium]
MKYRLPRFAFLLLITSASAGANAQCYTDPYTGQQICTRPTAGCPSCERQLRRLVSDSPASDTQSTNVDATAHCRISVADGTMGSGTLVDQNDAVGLVLTCAHLFDTSKSQIIVTFSNGRRFGANLIDLDKANDLAALTIRRPNLTPLSVSDTDPTGPLTACGFGPNGVFRSVRGNITGHPMANGATYPSTTILGAVRPGDSGGGVIDSKGQIVGVVWGQRDGQTYATCGQPLREFLKGVRDKVFGRSPSPTLRAHPQSPAPSRQFDWQTWTAELDKRIRDIDAKKQNKGDYLQPGDLNRYLKIDDATKLANQFAPRSEIEAKLKSLASQFASIHTVVDAVRQHVGQITGGPAGVDEGVSLAKYAVGALGLSGPLAAAVIIAGGLFGRRIKSRLQTLESIVGVSPSGSQNAATKSQPVAVDSPPPPQRAVPETHYVPVENDAFAKAHQWASEHVARKYPGATEILQAQDSLIKQFLAAK